MIGNLLVVKLSCATVLTKVLLYKLFKDEKIKKYRAVRINFVMSTCKKKIRRKNKCFL